MNNIKELICQSRIKEISCGSAPLIGEKERLALTAMHWYQEHQSAVEVFQETGRGLLLAQEQNTALIAQLEAAQKERDALREVNIGVGSSTRAAADIYFQLVEELEVPAGGSLVGVIDNLKAKLSAANEKLTGDQVPVAQIVISNNWPDVGRKVIDYYLEKIQHLPVGTELFTAPQKPVVLPDYRCSPDMHTKQYYETIGFNLGLDACKAVIKAAGFTVEE
ncbi:TPA: hypothetical protein U5D40_002548 [Yersinia enterocolitica]|nr:hypothetical protein [Yersinia enterocolitica]